MPGVVIVAGPNAELKRVRVEVHTKNLDDAKAKALELADSGFHVLLVAYDAWRVVAKLRHEAEARGVNPLLIHPLDPREAEAVNTSLDDLAAARVASLAYSVADRAPARLSTSKETSRRMLLRQGPLAALQYRRTVVLLDPQLCGKLKSCRHCLEACPHDALKGKPPVVDEEKCTGCSLCASYCPVSILAPVSTAPQQLLQFLEAVHERLEKPYPVVFVCENVLEKAQEIVEAKTPILLYPIGCHGDATLEVLLAYTLSGFTPILFCSECPDQDYYFNTVAKDYEKLVGRKLTIASTLDELMEALREVVVGSKPESTITKKMRIVEELNRLGRINIVLETPFAGTPVVDEEKCTLCGSCIPVCPTRALSLEQEGDDAKLVVQLERCIACMNCVGVCPENAIKVYKMVSYGRKLLASDRIVRCLGCGAVIGSARMILAVARKLKAAGMGDNVLATLLLCPTCKVKYQLGLLRVENWREELKKLGL